jgi:hypothetical protein
LGGDLPHQAQADDRHQLAGLKLGPPQRVQRGQADVVTGRCLGAQPRRHQGHGVLGHEAVLGVVAKPAPGAGDHVANPVRARQIGGELHNAAARLIGHRSLGRLGLGVQRSAAERLAPATQSPQL